MKTTLLLLASCLAVFSQNIDYSRVRNTPGASVKPTAKGDGVTDDTAAIQAAINSLCATGGVLTFPPTSQYYLITSGLQISSCSNLTLQGAAGAEIRVKAGTVDTRYSSWPNYGKDSVIRILNSTNITISGLILNGNLSNRTAYVGGESYNSSLVIAGSTNVHVEDSVLKEGMTDGVTVLYNVSHTTNTNVWIARNQILNCRRNNISGVAQSGLHIVDNVITGAGTIQGVLPKSGIDIEPDYLTAMLSNDVHVLGNTVSGSAGTYAVSFGGYGTAGLVVANNIVHDNTSFGVNFESYDTVHINTAAALTGNSIYSNGLSAVRTVGKNLDSMIGNTLKSNYLGLQPYLSDGLVVAGNLFDSNLNGAVANGSDASLGFINLSLSNNIFANNNSALGVANSAGWVLQLVPASASSYLLFNTNLLYGAVSATYPPKGLSFTGACNCLGNGNLAHDLVGLISTFNGITGWNHIFGLGGTNDTFYSNGLIPSANFGSEVGTANGLLRTNNHRIDIFGNAAPSTGAWLLGDYVLNSIPASGQPMGWVCTAAGSPGTWKSLPNIP